MKTSHKFKAINQILFYENVSSKYDGLAIKAVGIY